MIKTPPQSQTVPEDQPATFEVSAGGIGTLRYQWLRDGTPIAGATSARLILPATRQSDSGARFAVNVGNANGEVQSGTALLTVNAAPPRSDAPAQSIQLMAGQPITLNVTPGGSLPMTFQWRRNQVPIDGAISSTYVITNPSEDDAATYDVVITNAVGSVTSAPFTVSTQAQAPSVATPPQNLTVRVGESARFNVVVAGTAPMTYQWRRNGVPIVGASESVYTLPAAAASDDGVAFSVSASNAAGTVSSATAVLTVLPQPGIALYAGTIGGIGNIDGVGRAALFYQPGGVAIDAAGNIFVSDLGNSTLRRISPNGTVTTFAGTPQSPGSTDGNGNAARFNMPGGAAFDSQGNLFVPDEGNHTIRKVTPAGVVSTFAGTAGNNGSADGIGGTASFSTPAGLAIDALDNLYVTEIGNHTVRKITPAAVVTTLAGMAGNPGSNDGMGAAASFRMPTGITVDGAGNLYVSDAGNNLIRRVAGDGTVTTVAGSAGVAGSTDGTGSAALFNFPNGIAFQAPDLLYVGDFQGHTIRKVTTAGVVTTLAGNPANAGAADGSGAAATFQAPTGLAVDGSGNLVVADYGSSTIRRITAAGVVTTIAGDAGGLGDADGPLAAARFTSLSGIAFDRQGNIYLSDLDRCTIRKISTSAQVSTLAGTPGVCASVDGTGASASLKGPLGMTVDNAGNLYVAEAFGPTVRRISPAGGVTTLAGSPGVSGGADGTGSAASFAFPLGLVLDSAGNLFVSDMAAHTIRRITPAGSVSTVAGVANTPGYVDAVGTSARLNQPAGLVIDAADNLYFAELGNHLIRRITPAGVVTTIAGTVGNAATIDGDGSGASFNNPGGITLDPAGNLYVTEIAGMTVRKVTMAGQVSTVAGVPDGRYGVRLGALPGHLAAPRLLAMDPAGHLLVPDQGALLSITLP